MSQPAATVPMRLERRVALPACAGTVLAPALGWLAAVDETVVPGYRSPPRILEATTLFLTHAGTATTGVDGLAVAQRPGGLVAVARGAELSQQGHERPWRSCYLMLNGPWADGIDVAIRARGGGALAIARPSAAWSRALAEAVQLALDQPPAWAWGLLSRLALLAEAFAAGLASVAPLPVRAGRLIDAEPDRAWKARDLAAALGVGLRTLQSHWLAEVGEAPARWIMRRRIAHARLLLDRGLGVAVAADALGFADPAHFSRVFSRLTGAPPSRRQAPAGAAAPR